MSMVGFMVYYTHFLDPFKAHRALLSPRPEAGPAAADHSQPGAKPIDIPLLIMGGYSYGAMIATQLPPIEDILPLFSSPETPSPAAEIRHRAQQLAQQQTTVISSIFAARAEHSGDSLKHRSRGVRIGFHEEGSPRRSHDSRRSLSLEEAEEKIKKGLHDLAAKAKLGRKHGSTGSGESHELKDGVIPAQEKEKGVKHLEVIESLVTPRTAYLLVSPLQGIVTNLATMNFKPTSIGSWFTKGNNNTLEPPAPAAGIAGRGTATEAAAAEQKLVEGPTLSVFGDQDIFVASKHLRKWAARLEQAAGSNFVAHEIATAGHFWVEEGVLDLMRERVQEFAAGLLALHE